MVFISTISFVIGGYEMLYVDIVHQRELIKFLTDILGILAISSDDESLSYEESLRLIKLTSTAHLMLDYFKL